MAHAQICGSASRAAAIPITGMVLRASLVFVPAVALALVFGINVLIIGCAAVSLGEFASLALSSSVTSRGSFCPTILALNAIAWLSPLTGLFVAGFTWGIADGIIADQKLCRFYKSVSIAAISLSLACLALLNLLQ
ncbi:MAG: hypothetical protein IPM23_05450 [Candidatus Melainabacteria bacterium]|nr:hypothetical protein [Candidatus Melainabacteria bacterium]